jgi:hypothetical protein
MGVDETYFGGSVFMTVSFPLVVGNDNSVFQPDDADYSDY